MLPLALVVVPSPALAGDSGACRHARREASVEGWTTYVLEHPGGRCEDEALGQLLLLSVGRMMKQLSGGDATQVALAMAQLSRTDAADLGALSSVMGGGGIGALGGLAGMGAGGLFGGAGGLFGDPGSGDYGFGGLGTGSGYAPEEPTIYVTYAVDKVEGGWNNDAFFGVLDATRPALQDCWRQLGKNPMGVYYLAKFEVKAGALTLTQLEQTYSDDGGTHADVEACVRSSLETAAFPAEYAGTYSYRIELY